MTKKIHKEGKVTVLTGLFIFLCALALCLITKITAIYVLTTVIFVLLCFVTWFFRDPERSPVTNEDVIFAPADGKIVICEEVDEEEYLNERRFQISIFMSIWNVHANNYPVSGTVEYCKHHNGQFMVAWHPKSSEENERTTTVVRTKNGKILFRQIAGLVARRIVCYAEQMVGKKVVQNEKLGFIKFGSRMDIMLPLNAKIEVKLGQKVKSTRTILARLDNE